MSVKSSGTMPSLSHIKKRCRAFKHKPRPGQQRALDALASHSDTLNVKLPTGYGKTYVLLGAYSILRDAGVVNRNLIVVPTVAQLDQLKDASLCDYALDGEIVDVGFYGTEAIKKHRQNKGHIFAVTIQSLLKNAGLVVDTMMQDGSKWMVTVDEYHHYGAGRAFAEAIESLPKAYRLCLSATPVRANDELAFGDPDIPVTYREAAEDEKVIKVLKGEAYYYVLDLIDEDGDVRSVSVEELAEEAGGNSSDAIESLIIKRRMRWSPKYISPLISTPLLRLMNTRIRTGKRAKAIVGAMCVSHAELIKKQVESTFPALSVDWVGTGENGRSAKENKKVVKDFRNGCGADVLVHVGIAGEGLDVPEITEVIHCNSAGLNVSNNQENGRAARFSDGLPTAYISFDSSSEYAVRGYVGKSIMDAMEFESPFADDEELDEKEQENDIQWDDLPDELLEIEDIRLERIDNGDPEVLEVTRRLAKDKFADLDVEAVMQDENHPLRELVAGMVLDMRNNQANALREEHSIEKMSSELKMAVNVLAGNIVKRICRESGVRFDRAMIGDICKRIRTRLKRDCGPVVKDLEKLRQHYATLKSYEMQIKTGELPSWLK